MILPVFEFSVFNFRRINCKNVHDKNENLTKQHHELDRCWNGNRIWCTGISIPFLPLQITMSNWNQLYASLINITISRSFVSQYNIESTITIQQHYDSETSFQESFFSIKPVDSYFSVFHSMYMHYQVAAATCIQFFEKKSIIMT